LPAKALQHFDSDIARARALVALAESLPQGGAPNPDVRSDVLRAGWMFAVGALDAYFCEAYTDLVASLANSKSRQPSVVLPEWAYDIRLPLRAVLEQYGNANWRWRIAARKLMERENVISLDAIQKLFNKFFRKGHKLFGDVLPFWLQHAEGKVRMLGTAPADYLGMSLGNQNKAQQQAIERLTDRFRMIFQRRHDCIHSCDRPKISAQPLDRPGTVLNVIEDIEFLVNRCDDHIQVEFRQFLQAAGCSPATVAQAGY
jgi:predicted secreted protein